MPCQAVVYLVPVSLKAFKEHRKIAVSYTHLDVYKRQPYDRGHPAYNQIHPKHDDHEKGMDQQTGYELDNRQYFHLEHHLLHQIVILLELSLIHI